MLNDDSFDIIIDGSKVGYLSVPHPTVLENIDKKCAVAFFEIFTERFAEQKVAAVKYREPSKFPAIDIDVTFEANIGAVVFSEVVRLAKEAAGEALSDVRVKDVYTAEDGSSALTLRFSFSSKERTLTKQELLPVIESVQCALAVYGMPVKA